MKYTIYLLILFLLSCSMNIAGDNINKSDKLSNVEFKINKKVGVQIND